MYRYLLAAALIVTAQSAVFAGGGGSTKSTGSITVFNKDSTRTLLVSVDPSASLSSATMLSEFTARGGKVVNAGGSTTFPGLRIGNRNVFFAFVTASTTSLSAGDFTQQVVRVDGGRTRSVNLTAPSSSSSSSN